MGSNGALEASRTSSSLSSPFESSRGIMANNYMSEEAEEDESGSNPELLDEHHDPGQNGAGQNGKAKLRSLVMPSNNEAAAAEEAAALRREDFLVSFLVDARGGSLKGCRYSGVKVIIPPKTAPQPMRITCRYIRENALLHPPTLNEGEGLACRLLQVGPRGSKFLGPVLIEVPHVASLRDGDREVVVLRCDSASKGKWTQHVQEKLDDKTLKEFIDESTASMSSTATSTSNSSPVPKKDLEGSNSRSGSRLNHHSSSSPFHQGSFRSSSPQPPGLAADLQANGDQQPQQPRNVIHIVTKDFPQYFAIVSRPRQDIATVGPEGAILASLRVPKAQVYHKPKSLVKRVNVGMSVQPIEDETVEEIMVQGGAVSPIVTIEPRRRKFHKAITVTMPLPERMSAQYLRRKQENLNTNTSLKKDPSKNPIGANDATVNPHKKPTNTPGILPPSPKSRDNFDTNSEIEMSLRLVCSMSGNHAKAFWEDVTDNTPMTVVLNKNDLGLNHVTDKKGKDVSQVEMERDVSVATDLRKPNQPQIQPIEDKYPGTVQFTSLVSASFWLVHCPNWMSSDVISLVDQIYKNALKVPYFCRFHIYARRYPSNPASDSAPASPTPVNSRVSPPNNPAHIRVLCLTEPARAVHPLELQEDFVELGRSDYVEVRDNSEIEVHFGGNLYKSHRSSNSESEECDEFEYDCGSRKLIFHPFSDNRQGYAVKRRNEKNPYGKGSISFLTSGDRTLFEQKLDLSRFM